MPDQNCFVGIMTQPVPVYTNGSVGVNLQNKRNRICCGTKKGDQISLSGVINM